MPTRRNAVRHRRYNSTQRRFRRAALLLAIGANILIWSVIAISIANQEGSLSGLFRVPTVVALPWARARPISPLPRDDASLLSIGDDTLVIALLGRDTDHSTAQWRTDSIILVFIQQQRKQIGLLSVPRDLWIVVPDDHYARINTVDALGEQAQPGGGRALIDKTFRHNLGVPIDRVVRIDFQGFVRVIDALGGVTVDVERPIVDRFPDPLSPTGEFQLDLAAGPQHLDGRTALAYCRSRMTTSDFDRSRRQRQVLVALWKQAFTVQRLAQASELWATLGDTFQTDLQMVEAVQLAHLVSGIEAESVRSASIDATLVDPWTTPQGAQVLLPKTDAIKQAILDLLSPSD